LARSLGMDPDRLSAEQIDREMRANDMRAIRIEALVDDIGSTDAIDSFHRLAGSRDRLAQTVGEDDTQRLTPERVADAVTDSSTRGVLRRQQIDALTDYYNAVRQENSSSAMRARDRLVRALGAEPERVYPRRPRGGLRTWPDPTGLDGRNLTALVRERIDDPATREAVADFARALGDADPFTDGLRWNPAVDPRVVDGEVPLRDPNVMAHLGRIVGDDNRLLAADPGDPDTVPAEPDRDWARLLGLDLTDATPRQFIRAYEAYRDGRIDKFERLSADQLAKVHATMRGEVGRRAADLRALAELRDRYERTLDDLPENRHRNIERLQREWGDAVRRRELAAAELDRYAAEFGLRGDELRSDTLKHGTALEDLIRRIPDPNADTEIRPGLDREIFRFHERREGLSRTVRDYHLIEARADELRARLEAARERDAMLTEQEREDAAARTEHPGHTEPGTAAEPEAAEPGGAEPGGVAESHTARREASAQPHAAESETAVEPDSRAGDHTAAHHDPRGPETGDSSDSRRSPVPSASDGDAGGEPPGSGVPPDVPPHDWSNRGGAADDWHRTGPDDLHRPTGRELRKALRQLSDATARRDRAWNAMVGRARELGVDPARIRRDLLREAIIREIHSGEATFDRRRDLHGLLNEFDQGTVDLIVNARARRLGVALPTDHQVADALRDRLAQPGQRGHELATELAERRTVSRYRLERIAEELGIDPAGRTRRQLQDELRAAARDYPDRIGVDRRRSAVELVDRFRVAAATRSMRHDAAQQQAEHEVMRQRAGDQRKGPRIPGVSYRRFRLGTADRALVEGAAGERGRWVGVGSGDAPESRMPEQERRIHLGEGYDSVYYRVRLDADGHVWVGEYEPPHTTPIEPEPAQAAPRRPGDWEPIGAEREYRPGRNAPRWKARNLQQEVAELSKMADDNLASLNEAFQQIESLPKERTAYHVEPEPHGRLGRGRMTSRELEQAVRRLIADRRAQADEFWNRDGIDQRDLGAFLAEREAVEAWAGDTEEAGSALLGLLRVYEDAYLSQVDRAKMNLAVLAAHDIRSEFAGDGIGPDGLPATGPDEVAHRIPGDGQVPDRLVVVAPTANPDHVLAPAVRDELTGTDGEFIFQRVRVDDTGTVWIADMREPDLQLGSGGHPVELEATPAETAPEYPADPDARVGGEHDVTVADPGEFAQHQLDRLLAERERVVVQRHLWFEKARDYRRRWFSDISIDVLDSEGASDRAGRLAETLRQLQNETGFSVEREFGMDAPALTTHEQYGERELEQRHHQVRTLARALEHYLHHGTELGDIDRAIRRLEDQGAVYDPMRVVRFDDEARRLEAGYRDAVREAKPLRATLHELTDRLTGDREHPPSADDLRRLAAATEVVERADHEIDLFNDRRVARRSAGGWNDAVAEHWRAEVGARP
ncbi:MAG: hypothetical protein J2P18_19375, partial [Nocardia sp.]|nr:hypothetical protein [Nocardia sp.]